MAKLVILDRDGVINEDREDWVKSIAEFHFIDGSIMAIKRLNEAGYAVAVATNQSCINRGVITWDALHTIHQHMQDTLARAGARLDAIYVAPDYVPSPRRKPAAGMLYEALRDFHAVPAETPFIGDAERDIQAAITAGCVPILVRTGKGRATEAALPQAVRTYDCLADAVDAWLA
jgi:D-glycero-D-manno-heptose 1,7-bisphosphate phosphatase